MTIGYRSIIEIDDPRGALAIADEQFRAWLRSKKLDQRTAVARDEWDGPGIYDIGEGTTLTVINEAGTVEDALLRDAQGPRDAVRQCAMD